MHTRQQSKNKNINNNSIIYWVVLLVMSGRWRELSYPLKQLSQNLNKLWQESHVAREYRGMVMRYIEGLPLNQREKYMLFEIEWNKNQQSHYYEIFRTNMRRKIALFKLRTLLNLIKSSLPQKLQEICQILSSIRQMNAEISQKIIDMIKFYSITIEQEESTLLLFIWNMLNNLHQDNLFVVDSQVSQYIHFSKGYDPYFIYYYERQSKFALEQSQKSKYLKCFYNLDIKQIYRIINLRTQVMTLKSKIQKKLQELHCNYEQQQTFNYLEEEKIEPFSQSSTDQMKNHNRLEQSRRKVKHSRTMSHDIALKKDEPIERRAISNNRLAQGQSQMGKIVHHGEPSSISDSFDFGTHLRRDKIRLHSQSKGQSRNEENYQKKLLKLVQLEPINIYIQKKDDLKIKSHVANVLRNGGGPQKDSIKAVPSSLNSNLPIKKYDYNQHLKSNRIPGFIKNLKLNTQSQRKQLGLMEQQPIKSRKILKSVGVQTENIEEQKTKQNKEQQSVMVKDSNQLIDQPIMPKLHKICSGMMQQSMQTDHPSQTQLVNIKVDVDCQTELQGQYLQHNSTSMQRQSQHSSQKQECNDPQQHLQAVSFINQLNNRQKLEDSLVTLDEQYFIDERSTPIKRFKIPLIRTITDLQLKAIDHQKQQIAKYSKKKSTKPFSSQIEVGQKNDKKDLRIKIGKLTLNEVLNALKTYKIIAKYKQIFHVVGQLEEHITCTQTYVLEYYINDAISVLALASPIPTSRVVLKLWAPIETTDAAMSHVLFQKYIQYLSSNLSNKIIYQGEYFQELTKAAFISKPKNIYEKSINNSNYKKRQFEEFLSVKCSNITLSQNHTHKFQWQGQIQRFGIDNYYCADFIRQVNASKAPEAIFDAFIEQKRINNLAEANKILSQSKFNLYKSKQKESISDINLLMFEYNSPLKINFRSEGDLFFLEAILMFEDVQKLIIGVPLLKNNAILYFSKGIKMDKIQQSLITTGKGNKQNIKCKIKMFSKVLTGQLGTIQAYAHWELNFVWEDEIKSANIKHSFDAQRQFITSPFCVSLAIKQKILYSVQINHQDFLY